MDHPASYMNSSEDLYKYRQIQHSETGHLHAEDQSLSAEQDRLFTFFPKLPTEIRIMIWKLMPIPRVIRAGCFDLSCESSLSSSRSASRMPRNPEISCVCQESRMVFKELYTGYTSSLGEKWPVYANLDIDAVLLCGSSCYPRPRKLSTLSSCFNEPVTDDRRPVGSASKHLRRLVLEVDALPWLRCGPIFAGLAENLPDLEELYIIRQTRRLRDVELKLARHVGEYQLTEWESLMALVSYGISDPLGPPLLPEGSLRTCVARIDERFSVKGVDTYEDDVVLNGPANTHVRRCFRPRE